MASACCTLLKLNGLQLANGSYFKCLKCTAQEDFDIYKYCRAAIAYIQNDKLIISVHTPKYHNYSGVKSM